MEQQAVQLLSTKEFLNMGRLDLERYKVQMSLAAMRAPTELEREQYREHMNRANTIINNRSRY